LGGNLGNSGAHRTGADDTKAKAPVSEIRHSTPT